MGRRSPAALAAVTALAAFAAPGFRRLALERLGRLLVAVLPWRACGWRLAALAFVATKFAAPRCLVAALLVEGLVAN